MKYREHALAVARRAIIALEKRGFTQTQIGKMWGGLRQGTISELKTGHMSKLGVRVLLGMRHGLRMTIDELLGLPPIDGDTAEPPPSRRVHQ